MDTCLLIDRCSRALNNWQQPWQPENCTQDVDDVPMEDCDEHLACSCSVCVLLGAQHCCEPSVNQQHS